MAVLLIDPDQKRRDLLQFALERKNIAVSVLGTRTEGKELFQRDPRGYSVVLVGPSNEDPVSRTEFANDLYGMGDGDKPRVIDYSLATPDDNLIAQAADLHLSG